MLPHVDPEQGHEAGGGLQGVLVGARGDLQLARGLVVAQPTPAGALETRFMDFLIKIWLRESRMYYLDGDCRCAQLGLHALKTAKVSIDGLSQGT